MEASKEDRLRDEQVNEFVMRTNQAESLAEMLRANRVSSKEAQHWPLHYWRTRDGETSLMVISMAVHSLRRMEKQFGRISPIADVMLLAAKRLLEVYKDA